MTGSEQLVGLYLHTVWLFDLITGFKVDSDYSFWYMKKRNIQITATILVSDKLKKII